MNDFSDDKMEQVKSRLEIETHTRESICDIHGKHTEKGASFSGREVRWYGCHECKEIKNKAEREQAEIENKKRQQIELEEKFHRSGVPARFLNKTLESFIADTKQKTNALTEARDFIENFDDNYKNGRTLIFSGKAGTGKSHLAIAILKAAMPKYSGMYLNALDAIRMIKDTWRKDSEKSELQVLEMFGKIGLLVIDEVGVQYGTDNEQMLMFDIINRRYRDNRPIILLTNLNTSGFKEYMTERSYDRLRENGKWVSFDWESYRGKQE